MDSGVAAIIGAVTGAAASVLVVLIDRVVGTVQGRAERKRTERLELRTALLELNRALVALSASRGGAQAELAETALRADLAMAALDLLVSHEDNTLIAAANQVAHLAITDSPDTAKATAVFRRLSGEWYRRRITATVLFQRFTNSVFPES